jgi:CDP-glycerol glycerophosphotransferase
LPDSNDKANGARPRGGSRLAARVGGMAVAAIHALAKRSVVFRRAAKGAITMWRHARYRLLLLVTPVDPSTVVFEAFQGRSYACSPKALYRAMLADPRFDGFTFIWALCRPEDHEGEPDLDRATIVAFNSPEYTASFARARYWITNTILPVHLTPRDGQVYLQTWHGTPLKRLGCDIREGSSANAMASVREIHERYTREGKRLTYLLSPSAFATEKLGSAFALGVSGRSGAIIEEGYPRNDMLAAFAEADTGRIRDRLGIPKDKTVILYAPTFRDDQHKSGTGYTLDLGVDFARLREDIGDDHVVLFRAHYLVASGFDFAAYEGFVYDVSRVDDINELYIASDMLVTDYSSVFFDYANLQRPIIFFMYDLARYAEELRGIYLDVAELPGPITRTQDDLVSAVREAATPTPELAERYRAFNARFTYLDDGHASERVIGRVFDTRP